MNKWRKDWPKGWLAAGEEKIKGQTFWSSFTPFDSNYIVNEPFDIKVIHTCFDDILSNFQLPCCVNMFSRCGD